MAASATSFAEADGGTRGEPDQRRARTALQALNFFMADMQAGIGPFLGVFLQGRGWTSGPIGTAVAGITLGIVRQRGFNAQNGRNQAWNHAGKMTGAGLSGWLGWRFGMPAIYFLAAAFGVLAIASVLTIPEHTIDRRAARGLEGKDAGKHGKADGGGPRLLAGDADLVRGAAAARLPRRHLHRALGRLARAGA